jgi:hypothetical protein
VAGRTSSGPFGAMLSPIYVQKLQQNDFEIQSGAVDWQKRSHYQKERAVVIQVRWWNEVREFFLFVAAFS